MIITKLSFTRKLNKCGKTAAIRKSDGKRLEAGIEQQLEFCEWILTTLAGAHIDTEHKKEQAELVMKLASKFIQENC